MPTSTVITDERALKQRVSQRFRLAESLPVELREHCIIYFEESLDLQALSLLTNVLLAGTSNGKAFVPPPNLLSFIATLSVHPAFTTRAESDEQEEAGNKALQLLRQVHECVGAIQANFAVAFAFRNQQSGVVSRRKPNRIELQRAKQRENKASVDDDEEVKSIFASEQSLWSNAREFWHVVGWAFNCSVKHKPRWQRWKLWLDFMVDVLERDWQQRLPTVEGTGDVEDGTTDQSMIVQYLAIAASSKRAGLRQVLRAVFADGSPRSMTEFNNIFKNETRGKVKKTPEDFAKKRKLDLDNGFFGDYYVKEEDVDVGTAVAKDGGLNSDGFLPPSTPDFEDENDYQDSQQDETLDSFGGMESVELRRRLLILLVDVASKTGSEFFVSEHDAFEDSVEFIRALPIPVFANLTSPISIPTIDSHVFSNDALVELNIEIIRLISQKSPRTGEGLLDQKKFQSHYLPLAANGSGIGDNVKMSLACETILRLLRRAGQLVHGPELVDAVTFGIAARRKKVADVVALRHSHAGIWLAGSESRLRQLARITKKESNE